MSLHGSPQSNCGHVSLSAQMGHPSHCKRIPRPTRTAPHQDNGTGMAHYSRTRDHASISRPGLSEEWVELEAWLLFNYFIDNSDGGYWWSFARGDRFRGWHLMLWSLKILLWSDRQWIQEILGVFYWIVFNAKMGCRGWFGMLIYKLNSF